MRGRNWTNSDAENRSSWIRRHQRAPYILVGLAIFLPSWIIGLWQLLPTYGSSSSAAGLFGFLTLICLSWVIVPCGLGRGAFRRRYRPVIVSKTDGDTVRTHAAIEVRNSEWTIAIMCALFGLFFIPFVFGQMLNSNLFYIVSLFLPIGSVLLGLGSFNVLTHAGYRLRKIHLRLPE
jgi:hypothetical protein